MTQICEDFRQLADEWADRMFQAKGHMPSVHEGDAQATVVEPGQVVVVWLPAHAEPHLAGDLSRFIDAQCAERGVTLPVVVTLADKVEVRSE
jgi:hypothetical protein